MAKSSSLIAIMGPTASGKSELGVALAKRFHGEVVSADSRQVYRGLDIGSGKITQKEMMGIPHHLLDVVSPKRTFTVVQYQRRAIKAIAAIRRRHKLPFLVGGSPFYIYSVVDGIAIPEVKPNQKLRRELEQLSVEKLLAKLKALDPARANTIEQKNKRRLVRALEIVITTGKPIPPLRKNASPLDVLMLGIRRSPEELKKRIQQRLNKRFKQGMVKEVERLHKQGVSWRRLEEFGLEYRYVAQFLQGRITKQEMIARIQKESEAFVRRQMVWFKKDPRIHWISTYAEAKRLVELNLQ
ncbi:MAG: tRNA dimethylallyltransferase [Candidatus Nomurabacteria bacterium GW2011_GWA1_46_11]|uniref:tRNA dimethylallyltransferase n=3 Tax=Parcubacteria group TaxID=1794811 RepID=A0A1G2RKH2_9BACT|nr:MAG: tRNA dimethylallyltransferase [Candidatus Nomurabacteria bacterium GW2011_GWA1_46_11]OHA63914.1 MAG: tRNA (adenosine(37)-N6)-dimethylallyltransferase MiaA [Candidatus Wildermuthbacteria bacterium RIFCSPHIGHO2_01_FULL_48_27b]OHA73307.1 MAG: tRNA (adenosine(37)-N6)-dimethylallyltransferase MiaA [Candidatus Wildermuthbacteria bacterium RIFCSPLOWO2_01_FULL_48_29]